MKATSLSAQLSRSLLALVCGFWLLGSAAVAWYVSREIAESLDSSLVHSAHRLIELAAHEIGESGYTPPNRTNATAAPQALTDPLGGEYLMYQVVDTQGLLQLRSPDAPTEALALALRTGFSHTGQWRVYTLRHPVQPLYIHVADALAHRQQARNESLLFLALPLLAVLPLLAFGVQHLVARQMRVVDSFAAQVRERGGKNLAPVDGLALPDELRALAQSVNHLLARLQEALHTEQALAANAAHELRTPLAVAQLRLSNALNHAMPQAAQAEVRSASDALGRLKRQTEKLLQLSRAESGAALSRAPVSLNQVIAAVLQELDGAALDRLQVDVAGEQTVLGDFDAIAIALRNLVENSLAHGGQGAVEIQVASAGVLSVRDSGPGVNAAQLQALAQRHVHFSSAGNGLGLWIAKTIMERQGGQLLLSSPPAGRKSGFEARLRFADLA